MFVKLTRTWDFTGQNKSDYYVAIGQILYIATANSPHQEMSSVILAKDETIFVDGTPEQVLEQIKAVSMIPF